VTAKVWYAGGRVKKYVAAGRIRSPFPATAGARFEFAAVVEARALPLSACDGEAALFFGEGEFAPAGGGARHLFELDFGDAARGEVEPLLDVDGAVLRLRVGGGALQALFDERVG